MATPDTTPLEVVATDLATRVPDLGRVRLTRVIDRYPHFWVDAGARGTVTESTRDLVTVCMDDEIPGCEEWSNEILWNRDDAADHGYPDDARYAAAADLEVITEQEAR